MRSLVFIYTTMLLIHSHTYLLITNNDLQALMTMNAYLLKFVQKTNYLFMQIL